MAQGHYAHCTSSSFEDCWCEIRRYVYALGFVVITFAVQALGGWWFHSLALWADSAHLATDIIAYAIAIRIGFMVRRSSANTERLRRSGMVWSVVLLLLALGGMLAEVPGRFLHPPEVGGWGMIVTAVVAAIGNAGQHEIVSKGEAHATTHGLVIHILTDLVSSIGIILAGFLIILTGWLWLDAVTTLLVVIWASIRAHQMLHRDAHHHGHAH